jgi:hypothetical protein
MHGQVLTVSQHMLFQAVNHFQVSDNLGGQSKDRTIVDLVTLD